MAPSALRRVVNSLPMATSVLPLKSSTILVRRAGAIASTRRHFASTTNLSAESAPTTAATQTTTATPKPTMASAFKKTSSYTPKQPYVAKPKAAEPPPPTARSDEAKAAITEPLREYKAGLEDAPADVAPGNNAEIDWTRSFSGLSTAPFSKEAGEILMQPIAKEDIEIKPDGIIYLPEIKYRRILNRAFGPGGWGLAPRGETIVTAKSVTREYALLAHGRLVSISRGEQDYFDSEGIPTATEGCKSNALMRCCKDLGVASELWDPRFIRGFLRDYAKEVWVEHAVTKKRRKMTLRKDDVVKYPFQLSSA